MAEWQAVMSSAEFAEWVAYAKVNPFGLDRADLRAGIVASVIAEVYRDSKKRAEPYTPGDFMPVFDGGQEVESPPPDPAALFAKLKAGFGLV